MISCSIKINGQLREAQADGSTTLLEVLREQLGLTGAKCGCGYGVCGACTVLIDNKPARSCLALALNCEQRSVVTIEGIGSAAAPHPIQRALLESGVQCGFCVTGIILAAKNLLDKMPGATELEIRECLSGHMCRCTGYAGFVHAIKTMAGEAHG